ncbi:Putative arylsulfotransferase [Septoria linicola]|uniref:Arylsulfotransferase n=1 Tax=Septoria linicola TaxID=215465 RepID=A0A9Q9B011_9PEZI|nr:Putative arylsulfotransferase [Septoria linicola]
MSSTNLTYFCRNAVKWVLIFGLVLLSLYLSYSYILPIVAYLVPGLDPFFFDLGVFGAFPLEQYGSFDLGGPQARHLRWHDSCDAGLVLLTPNGPSVAKSGPMILDAQGELIWRSDEYGAAANLKVQRYRGEDYLTLWSGEKAATSGKGVYFMLDHSYQVVKMITAIGEGLFGDLHEFKLTEKGTALLTVYNTINADLTRMGMGRGPDGWIVDNMFQEIDIESGELLFQWSAAEHFDPAHTYMTNPFGGYWESIPFDFYHLNSVDKDSKGNYIISSRHFHHIMCISPTGETLWILGGRDNQFEDLSDGQATNFKWQHDARWVSEEESILTLFDNSKAGPLHSDASESRALVIRLDLEKKTAQLVHSMTSLQGILASSQGSVQLLPETQNFFVGWGSAAAYSEYSSKGDLLCETHLGASWYYYLERMKSYRATKAFNWRTAPQDPPQVSIKGSMLSVSWNGATEVAYWSLEGVRESSDKLSKALRSEDEGPPDTRDQYEALDVVAKTGFEGLFDLSQFSDEQSFTRFRVAALDIDHSALRYSEPYDADERGEESSYLMTMIKLSIVVGFLAGLRFAFKHFRSHGHLRAWSSQGAPAWTKWQPTSDRHISRTPALSEWIQMKWRTAKARPG